MISHHLVPARVLCGILKRSLSVALDTPSTSAASDVPLKDKGRYATYTDYVIKQFPEQLASLDALIKEADAHRRAIIDSNKYARLLELIHEKVIAGNCRLVPVGSRANALITDSSDLDLVFYPINENHLKAFGRDFRGNTDFREYFMDVLVNVIKKALREDGINVISTTILPRLRVPLIRIELNSDMSIDIQFPGSHHTLRNTHLIKMYSAIDERFPQLFLWVKTIFNVLEVRASAVGLLSTYHIILLTIHFLQSEQCLTPWTVLPILCKTHPDIVGPSVPIHTIIESLESSTIPDLEWRSKNKMPVSELAVRFIDYYHNFNASNNAIFIDRGLTYRRKQNISTEPQLLLIDPYSTKSVCQSVTALKAFKDAVAFIRKKIKIGQMIDTFPEFPESTLFKEETKWATWRQRATEAKQFNLSNRRGVEQNAIDED